ncbi:traB domain-containing protein [Leptinotarsa decemlineata]|uniref:traB domain-containing protein n=1 Tax=Leptinotarsa decemlineata TaxID=7539 RepID=UPI000C253757|nr:traB domain-containing protein [Leptinotarsa decemlineata]
MDHSLTNFELTESTVKVETSSDNGSGSDKSDPMEMIGYGDVESSSNKSDDDFDNNLPQTVTLLKHEKTGAKVYLIGTAHFSKESQEDVVKVITNVTPNIVILELCSSRINILSLDEETVLREAKNIDMQKIMSTIRSNGVYNGLMYLLLLNMSAHLTEEIGMAPGGEFRVAFKEASKIPNCGIHLGDRPINITLQRALARLSWFQTVKLAWHLLTSKEPVSIEEIEKCKNRDMLEQLLADLAGEYPAFREVFLDERDIFLTNSLQAAALSKLKSRGSDGHAENPNEPLRIVGVVGIGHVPGIIKLWPHSQEKFVKSIITIPPPSVTSKVIKYSFKLSILIFGGYLIYRYIPVPRSFRENVHTFAHKLMSGVRAESSFRFSLN